MSNAPQDQPTQPAGGQPPPYFYQPLPPYNTYAIIGLVLAIAVLPPLGIYFGAVAKRQIAESGERGIELANAAVIVGWVMSILMLAVVTLWCLVFGWIMTGFFGAATGTVPF